MGDGGATGLPTAELFEALTCVGWTVEACGGALRVRDDEGALVGVLDAELTANLAELFEVLPRAEA